MQKRTSFSFFSATAHDKRQFLPPLQYIKFDFKEWITSVHLLSLERFKGGIGYKNTWRKILVHFDMETWNKLLWDWQSACCRFVTRSTSLQSRVKKMRSCKHTLITWEHTKLLYTKSNYWPISSVLSTVMGSSFLVSMPWRTYCLTVQSKTESYPVKSIC